LFPFHALFSSHQKIHDVPSQRRFLFIKLGIAALRAGDGGEFLILHVEYLGKVAARRLDRIVLKRRATAFRTSIPSVHHRFLLKL
jgi:hypothetical protein